MSLREVAEGIVKAGTQVNYGTLSNIETGKARATVDLLMSASVVLKVSPARLLLPVDVLFDEPVDVGLPGGLVAAQAWSWITGTGIAGVEQTPLGRRFVRDSTPSWARTDADGVD